MEPTDPARQEGPLEQLVGLRLEMAAEGWESEDRITNAGWRDGMGYSIWFQRWDWHGQQTITLTGSQACYHAHTPHLTPEAMLRAAKEAAARARGAYAHFHDYPPQQMADGTLKVCRMMSPTAQVQPRRSPQGEGVALEPVVGPWIDLNDQMPEPEVFVLTWDGRQVGVDWWGSLRHRGDGVTHWAPFPAPPGAGPMYGLHSIEVSPPNASVEALDDPGVDYGMEQHYEGGY